MKITKILALAVLLSGCESMPHGTKFHTAMLPAADPDEATIVVFRDYTNPSGLDGRVVVDGTQLFKVPNHSFGYAALKSGQHSLQLKWGSMSGMSGWETLVNLKGGKTYYYQLKSAVIFLASSSELVSVPESLAKVTLNTCCSLVDEITPEATSVAAGDTTATRASEDVASLKVKFQKLKKEMSANEVLSLLGAPDDVASKKTWKTDVPFYFGPDDRWVVWTYKGAGYVAFIQNKFSGDIAVEKYGYGRPE